MDSARRKGMVQAEGPIRLHGAHRWLLAIGGMLFVVVAVAAGGVALVAHKAEPFLRARILENLKEHFHARVELESFHLSLGYGFHGEWGLWATGKGLRIWPPAEAQGIAVPEVEQGTGKPKAGVPESAAVNSRTRARSAPAIESDRTVPSPPNRPLVQLDQFRFHLPLRYQAGKALHIALIDLTGLSVDLPARSHFSRTHADSGAKGRVETMVTGISIDRIECDQAILTLETSKPGGRPKVFSISRWSLDGYSSNSAMRFESDVSIPKPQGEVHTAGVFGPWLVEDPGESVVAGEYKLTHADLGVFKGIAGRVDSSGHYQGTLRDLAVSGVTSTPDFRLTHFGTAMDLQTSFSARVDVTNGDTWLDRVDASLGRARFSANGAIVREAPDASHAGGHDIALAVEAKGTPVEDFLRLTSRSGTPLLSGAVTFKGRLHIPPGPVPVHLRLQLDGSFTLEQARFSSERIQRGIEQLSLRGQGHPDEVKKVDPLAVRSRMQGDFHLTNAMLGLPKLEYSVPGADIQLQGAYGFDGGTLDFAGTAMMKAPVSQMVGGWKGMLLKPADRLFRRLGAGTAIPLQIQGTRENPEFVVDLAGLELDLPRHQSKKD